MLYKCIDCENVFDFSEVKTIYERSEFWGQTVYETRYECPYCGGSFDEYEESEETEIEC